MSYHLQHVTPPAYEVNIFPRCHVIFAHAQDFDLLMILFKNNIVNYFVYLRCWTFGMCNQRSLGNTLKWIFPFCCFMLSWSTIIFLTITARPGYVLSAVFEILLCIPTSKPPMHINIRVFQALTLGNVTVYHPQVGKITIHHESLLLLLKPIFYLYCH